MSKLELWSGGLSIEGKGHSFTIWHHAIW